MPDLNELFTIASEPGAAETPASSSVDADLARAREAHEHRRRVRASWITGAATLSAIAVVGGLLIAGQNDDSREATRPPASQSPSSDRRAESGVLTLVSDEVDAGPYTFGQVPDGWDLQAEGPFSVTFTPPGGGVSSNGDDFVGKLVVMYDQNALGNDVLQFGGRDYTVHGDSGYTTISTPTLAGQPDGVVRVQYPDSAGWSDDTLREFLYSVTVNDSARPGVG